MGTITISRALTYNFPFALNDMAVVCCPEIVEVATFLHTIICWSVTRCAFSCICAVLGGQFHFLI